MIESAHLLCDFERLFDWNDLRYFLAVARTGTLSAAACELGVTHTTVARRLAALEEDLGAKLLRKGGESLSLTPEGTKVLALAEEVRKSTDAIERGVRHANERIAGLVRVTLPEGVADYLTRQLGELRERHPDLVVSLLVDHRPYDLLAGEADIALRIHPKSDGDLVERKLFVGAWSLYAARSYIEKRGMPREVADLTSHDLIGYEGIVAGTPGGRWFHEKLPAANFVLRGNSVAQVYNAAMVGHGITLLPCFMADPEPALVRVMEELYPSHPVRLLVPADLARLARVRVVMDFITHVFKRDEDLFTGRRPRT